MKASADGLALIDALADYTPEEVRTVCENNPRFASWLDILHKDAWANFRPRPDNPAEFDEQSSFCYSKDKVSILVGGNAAGTTEAGAFKASRFMLYDQPPPRSDTPFWVLSNTYDQCGDVLWKEKFLGHGHIPRGEIDWGRISWRDQKKNHPDVVPLKSWPGREGKNWTIHFKSYEQGRAALQAASIGGFFFSEQFPADVLIETLRGCREYMFPGGQFCEFTPIDPELSIWTEQVQTAVDEGRLRGWKFYRCNTKHNRRNLAKDWFESFFGAVAEEMLETRMTGKLATYEGAIYPNFNPRVHVRAFDLPREGGMRGIASDWGASVEHPWATVFGMEDGDGRWWIFDEYWNNSQEAIIGDKIKDVIGIAIRHHWPFKEALRGGLRFNRLMFGDGTHIPHYGDPAGTAYIRECTVAGLATQGAKNDVYSGIDCVKNLLRVRKDGLPGLIIHPRCKHLIQEMRKYRWQRGKKPAPGILNPNVAKPQPVKRDDDTVDALRYLLYSRAVVGGGGAIHRTHIPAAEKISQLLGGYGASGVTGTYNIPMGDKQRRGK